MLNVDLHTHTVASGHGTTDTIYHMAREAAARGMTVLGITDHAPATPGAARETYFRSLHDLPHKRCGITVLYGAEVNILEGGKLDLPDSILSTLDYAIASMHMPPRRRNQDGETSGSIAGNTADYLRAMENPYIRIIGHCDNTQFPTDHDLLTAAAARCHVAFEVNNASLTPGGYHQVAGISTEENYRTLLTYCRERGIPILISSDTHGRNGVGDAPYAENLVREMHFPSELIINEHLDLLFH